MTSSTKKYRLSFDEKGMVIIVVDDGDKKKDVAEQFGIPASTLEKLEILLSLYRGL